MQPRQTEPGVVRVIRHGDWAVRYSRFNYPAIASIFPSARAAVYAGQTIAFYAGLSSIQIVNDAGWQFVDINNTSIYFVQADGYNLVKIGITTGELKDRLVTLQPGSPVPLRLYAFVSGVTHHDERQLHEDLTDQWSHGEWFHVGPELQTFMDRQREWLGLCGLEIPGLARKNYPVWADPRGKGRTRLQPRLI